MFGEAVGRVSGVEGGMAREGVTLLLGGWLLMCVVEVVVIQSYVG